MPLKYEIKGDIQENEVSGVTTSIDKEKDPEGKGYYIDFDPDKHIAQVHITGGVESISMICLIRMKMHCLVTISHGLLILLMIRKIHM